MDLVNFFFKQSVKESELNLAFELVNTALQDLVVDVGITGVVRGGTPQPTSPESESIELDGALAAFDLDGKRITYDDATQTVDCSVDRNGQSTTVTTVGFERWVSVFVRWLEVASEPRIDGNNATVQTLLSDSYEIVIRQGAEASSGTAARHPLVDGELLLCDVRRVHGDATLAAADIDTTRRQALLFLSAANLPADDSSWTTLAGTQIQAALDSIDTHLTDHFAGSADKHAAGDIVTSEGGWSTLSGASTQLAIDSADTHLTDHFDGTSDQHAATAITADDTAWASISGASVQAALDATDGVLEVLETDILIQSFDTVAALIDDLPPGSIGYAITGTVKRFSDTPDPYTRGAGIRHIATDGLHIYEADPDDNEWRAVRCDDATVTWSEGLTGAPLVRMDTDGSIVALAATNDAFSSEIIIRATSDGEKLYEGSHTNATDIVCASHAAVRNAYFSDGVLIRKWSSSGGLSTFATRPQNVLALAVCGDALLAIENTSGAGSGLQLLSIPIGGGSATVLRTYASLPVNTPCGLTSDGDHAYVVIYDSGITDAPLVEQVGVWRVSGAPAGWSDNYGSLTASPIYTDIEVDDRFVYLSLPDDSVLVLNKHNGTARFQTASGRGSIAVDGTYLWTSDGDDTLYRYGTGRLSGRLWQRAASGLPNGPSGGLARKPARWLALPHGVG